MSKPGELRDAIATEIVAARGNDPAVDRVVLPEYYKEDLDQPRIAVMQLGTETTINMGVDDIVCTIGIAIVGLRRGSPDGHGTSSVNLLDIERDRADLFENITQEVASLWAANGALQTTDLAGYRFQTIERPLAFDPDQYKGSGVWVTVLFLTYRDLDEGDEDA